MPCSSDRGVNRLAGHAVAPQVPHPRDVADAGLERVVPRDRDQGEGVVGVDQPQRSAPLRSSWRSWRGKGGRAGPNVGLGAPWFCCRPLIHRPSASHKALQHFGESALSSSERPAWPLSWPGPPGPPRPRTGRRTGQQAQAGSRIKLRIRAQPSNDGRLAWRADGGAWRVQEDSRSEGAGQRPWIQKGI